LAPNYASLGFQATQTAEFGDFVHLTGTNRKLNTVTITMSNWALQSTPTNVAYCSTNPSLCSSAGFMHPFTLSFYNVGSGTAGTRQIGSQITTLTETKFVPWRPEADPTCSTPTAWRSPSDNLCYNGYAFNLTFDMSSLNAVLPNDVIVGIAYNTQTWGATPLGVSGPFDSLNVAAEGTITAGSDDNTDYTFWNTSTANNYSDHGGAGVGIFREDSNWSPYGTIPIKITTGQTFVVDDDLACPGAAYTSINAAIAVASTDDTIQVCSGNYNEDVVVNKTLKIQGAGAGTTTVSGPIGGGGATFQIVASNVDLSGFTITRDGNNPTDWNNAGLNSSGIAIQGQALSGTVIHDNVISGMRTAIDINNSNGHTVRNNVIDNNHTGLIFRNQTDNILFTENQVTNNRTVGVLFLDASGGSNSPIQTASNSHFTNNNISGNWYGGIVDRQVGGSLPAPGTTNLKNFRGNWYGSTSPVVTTANSAEPAYGSLIPVVFGGTATAPGGQPDIAGPASANFQTSPLLTSGTDTNVETTPGRGTFGFQGVASSTSGNSNGWFSVSQRTGSGNYVFGPATPPLGIGSFRMTTGAGNSGPDLPQGGAGTGGKVWLTTQQYDNTLLANINALSYSTYVSPSSATSGLTASLQFQVDLDGNGSRDTAMVFEPIYSVSTQGPITPGVWQNWNAREGKWWFTSSSITLPPAFCSFNCFNSFSDILAQFPNAKVVTWYGFTDGFGTQFQAGQNSAGAPWANFDGNVDNFVIGINTASTTTDFDPTTPSVTINQAVGQGDPTSVGPINFTATFSEPVTGFDGSDVTLTGPGSAGTTANVTGGPMVYNVAVSGMSANGVVVTTIASGIANGAISGAPNAPSTSTDNSVYYVATCNVVSIPTAIPTLTGVQLEVPINTDDLTGRSAFGYETSLTYDPAVLSYIGIQQVGTMSSNLTIVPNPSTPGILNISAFSTSAAALTGSGTLLKVRFQVIGSISPTPSPINFTNFVYNEGNPCSTAINGSVIINSGILSGTVTYVNGTPTTPGVPNVNMAGTGVGGNVSTITDGSGNYSMSGFGAGAYTVTPSKAPLPLGSFNSAITNVDSTRIAQHNVGLVTLNANQIIAGDVTGNGTVSNLDSTYIAQWKVGVANPGNTGTWIFQPSSRNYADVNASISGQNYNAILKGDVTGNWNPAEAPNFAPIDKKPSKDAVTVSVTDVNAVSGSEVVVPVQVSDLTAKGVTGYEFEINYDPKLLEPADIIADIAGTVSEGRTIVSNSPDEGRILIVVYGILPLNGEGTLLNLHFKAIGNKGSESIIGIRNLVLNENEIESYPVSGKVHIVESNNGGVIRGRVLSYADEGISGARVNVTDTQGRAFSVRTNTFGSFEIGNLKMGESYILTIGSKAYKFTPINVAMANSVVTLQLRPE